MAAYDHLQTKQFGVYTPPSKISTKAQSARVGKWLASDKGHDWQDSLSRVAHQNSRQDNTESLGFFSTRNPGIFGGGMDSGYAYSENTLPHSGSKSYGGTVMGTTRESLDERIRS